jgi:hypothetical protein
MHNSAGRIAILGWILFATAQQACAQRRLWSADSVIQQLAASLVLPWRELRLGMPIDTVKARELELTPVMAGVTEVLLSTKPRADKLKVTVSVASDVTSSDTPEATVTSVSVDVSTRHREEFLHGFRIVRSALRSLPPPDACERDSVVPARATSLYVRFGARWSNNEVTVGLSASIPRHAQARPGVPIEDQYHLHFRVWPQSNSLVGLQAVEGNVRPCIVDERELRAWRRAISTDSLQLLRPRLGVPLTRLSR